jgi:hypothetical protein
VRQVQMEVGKGGKIQLLGLQRVHPTGMEVVTTVNTENNVYTAM